MKDSFRSWNSAFASGAIGATIASVAEWASGQWKLTTHFAVAIGPSITWPWLCPRLIAGGLFGTLFVMPFFKSRGLLERGILIGLVPSFFICLYIFPHVYHLGYFGFELGALTPVFIFIYGAIWGWSTALWLKWTS